MKLSFIWNIVGAFVDFIRKIYSIISKSNKQDQQQYNGKIEKDRADIKKEYEEIDKQNEAQKKQELDKRLQNMFKD